MIKICQIPEFYKFLLNFLSGIVEVRVGDTPSATLEFSQNDYITSVDENEISNHLIQILHAERSDKTPAPVTYRIASGNEDGAFGIQSTSDGKFSAHQ